jgi:hypothetical protein
MRSTYILEPNSTVSTPTYRIQEIQEIQGVYATLVLGLVTSYEAGFECNLIIRHTKKLNVSGDNSSLVCWRHTH